MMTHNRKNKLFERFTNQSVFVKLLSVMIVIFVIFLLVSYISQTFFYEKFYIYTKTSQIENSIEAFSREYMKLDDVETINQEIVEHSNDSDSYMMIMGDNGDILHMLSYEMTVDNGYGELVNISLDAAIRDENFYSLDLEKGQEVSVAYFAAKNERRARIYIPFSIMTDSAVWDPSTSENHMFSDMRDMEQGAAFSGNVAFVHGVITSITLPNDPKSRTAYSNMGAAVSVATKWLNYLYEGGDIAIGEIINYIYDDTRSGEEYLVVINPIEKNGANELIFAVSTLESVSEAVGVIKDFNLFVFLITGVIAFILAVVLSKVITKPIVEISHVTKRMSQLDFSQKCVVSSNDEIGVLADNVNHLSERLDNTINELKLANEGLKSDIDRKLILEKQRREFVASVSHELKTPLGIIQAYSEALADATTDEKRRKYSKVIIDETKRMDKLVLDMLENSKLESGVMQLDKQSWDISELCRKTASRFVRLADERKISVVTHITDAIHTEFDYELIERVVVNFLSNAIRHTPDGGNVTITVSSPSNKVFVSIENSGDKIDDYDIDRIWDKFYKGDKSRKRTDGGTGLGLSISKNILILHKADYGARNTETGVMFWFVL